MTAMSRGRRLLAAGMVALLVAVADQISKAWAEAALVTGREVTAIPGWLWFRPTANSGATLGLLSGHNELFIGFSLLVLIGVAALLLGTDLLGLAGALALGAVAGGATGNLIDRLRLGRVTDFIEIRVWPTDFNLADAAIRIGVVVFLLALVLEALGARRSKRLS
jgi:signal peptidase II